MGGAAAQLAAVGFLAAAMGKQTRRGWLHGTAGAAPGRFDMLTSDPARRVIGEAIDRLNDIAAAIAMHQQRGLPDAGRLLDMIEDEAREIRDLLKAIVDADG